MNTPRLPRGVRNNNPLNIRFVKKNNWEGRCDIKHDKDFEEFRVMYYGYRAAFLLLHKYMYLYKLNCIYDVVSRWAPTSDGNDVVSYANRVSAKINVPIFEKIEWTDWRLMVYMAVAMAEVENGIDMDYLPALKGYIAAAQSLKYTSIAIEATERYNELTRKP